jgi:hypothetical protein
MKVNNRFFFTTKGNILVDEGGGRRYFQSIHGQYFRPCSDYEFQYLIENGIFEFQPVSELKLALEPDEDFPKWYHLKSVRTFDNYENFDPFLSSNGGKYSFHTTTHFFFSPRKDGNFKFWYIDEYSSSAEYQMTWDGNVTNSTIKIIFTNCETDIKPIYPLIYSPDGEYLGIIEEPIEKYLVLCELDAIFASLYTHVPERNENGNKGPEISDLFTEAEKSEMLQILNNFGYNNKTNRNKIRNSRR